MYTPPQPPTVNGVQELTEAEILEIQTKLQTIETEFIPTEDEPILSLHGLVSRYNQANVGAEINGDTAQFCLAYTTETQI